MGTRQKRDETGEKTLALLCKVEASTGISVFELDFKMVRMGRLLGS